MKKAIDATQSQVLCTSCDCFAWNAHLFLPLSCGKTPRDILVTFFCFAFGAECVPNLVRIQFPFLDGAPSISSTRQKKGAHPARPPAPARRTPRTRKHMPGRMHHTSHVARRMIRDGETYQSRVYVRDTPRGRGRRWWMAGAGGTLTPT